VKVVKHKRSYIARFNLCKTKSRQIFRDRNQISGCQRLGDEMRTDCLLAKGYPWGDGEFIKLVNSDVCITLSL
jgi:hypothetical protein